MIALALATALASIAFASGPRVLVLGSPTDPTVVRMRQELGVLGFDVEVAPRGASGSDLAALARARGAAAAAHVIVSPPSVALWFDPATAQGEAGAPAELTVDAELAGSADPALLALRAVELVRGRLLPVGAPAGGAEHDAGPVRTGEPAASAAAAPTTPAPPAPRPATRPRRAPVAPRAPSAFLSPSLVVSPGGLPAQPDLLLGGRFRLLRRLDLEALALAPTVGTHAATTAGDATVRPAALALGGAFELTDPAGPLFVDAGLGAGAALLFFSGDAAPPLAGSSGARAAALAYAHLAAGYALAPRVGLRLDVLAALVRPEPVLRIAGVEVGSFGAPLVSVGLGVEVRP